MKQRVAFKTLGCRLNQYETDAIVSQFIAAGYDVVDFSEKADAYVINTCTVTGMSDHKSRQAISQAHRRNPEAILVAAGCMVDNHPDLAETSGFITYTVDNERKGSVFQLLDSHFRGEITDINSLVRDRFAFTPAAKGFHSRSLIKIQDGCDNFCTFCIVPHVRGRARSRPWKDIHQDIRHVLGAGFREIVLTGVNIGRYESEGWNFERLVEQILEIPGDFRVRISSIEPEGFGDRLFRLFTHPGMTPHLHLCIQSGSDRILQKMGRNYTVDDFRTMVHKIRSIVPDFNFTTDIMVGFPGETEQDFTETCQVAEEIGFSHIHTFRYSGRKGTRAERLPEQIPEKIKSERSLRIREISVENKRHYREGFIGKTQRVLVEKINRQGFAGGYGEHYIPVTFRAGDSTWAKKVYDIRITGITEGDEPCLTGELI
ncbi:MAG: tRNA (N(6)-L-threonylcarbamoyladenosine(37)-C(2))-methylthiotransferase MtaB [Bacteroidales bacterium]|nr:tRNA (N(6)-L-threonylcarbamoyladenosine(37)-C(2))-methylthiotransferase MtaB [Bacteroidales bacterium]